ncbi:MAG: hypothetical protein OEU26_00065 [Candidatus Tectomicrobia bacterium]|nr:hypothetical protein [Candidatus Tectomicrobia bacterium]
MAQETDPEGKRLSAGAVLYQRQGITLAAMLMALALALSAGANLYQLWLSGSVHYIVVGAGKRMSRPGEVPEQALREVAENFVLLIGNGTPTGIRENWQDAEKFMTSNARAAFERLKAEQLQIIEAGNISLTTERVRTVSIHKERGNGYDAYGVTVSAQQLVRYGTLSMGSVEVRFRVSLLPGNKGSVHGLWVADFHWPPLSIPQGPVSVN